MDSHPTSGVADITTCGSTTNFDTVLYIRDADCSSGTELTCNDDAACAGNASRITPTVNAGTTYYIFVDGYYGAFGNFTLTVTAP